MMKTSPVQFGGVAIRQTDDPLHVVPYGNENWRFHLVEDNHPQIAGDQLKLSFLEGDARYYRFNQGTPPSPRMVTVSLRSPRILSELTEPFSQGRMKDAKEFPRKLMEILKSGDFTAEMRGSYSKVFHTKDGLFDVNFTADALRHKLEYYLPALQSALDRILNGPGEGPKHQETVVEKQVKKVVNGKHEREPGFFIVEDWETRRTLTKMGMKQPFLLEVADAGPFVTESAVTYKGKQIFAHGKSEVPLPPSPLDEKR